MHSKHITCADKIQSFDKTSGLNNVYDINISTAVKYEHIHSIQKVFIWPLLYGVKYPNSRECVRGMGGYFRPIVNSKVSKSGFQNDKTKLKHDFLMDFSLKWPEKDQFSISVI